MVGERVPDFCHQHLPFPVTTSSLSSWVRVEGVPQGPWGLSSRLPLRVQPPLPLGLCAPDAGARGSGQGRAGGIRAGAGAGEGAPRAGALARDPAPAGAQGGAHSPLCGPYPQWWDMVAAGRRGRSWRASSGGCSGPARCVRGRAVPGFYRLPPTWCRGRPAGEGPGGPAAGGEGGGAVPRGEGRAGTAPCRLRPPRGERLPRPRPGAWAAPAPRSGCAGRRGVCAHVPPGAESSGGAHAVAPAPRLPPGPL